LTRDMGAAARAGNVYGKVCGMGFLLALSLATRWSTAGAAPLSPAWAAALENEVNVAALWCSWGPGAPTGTK
jgi:hypothetical protein